MHNQLDEYCKNDDMMALFYDEYIVQGNIPSYEEVQATVRFFTTFSIGCLQRGLDSVGQSMGRRLDAYIGLLRRIGWKSGKYLAGGRTFGLETIISGALTPYLGE